MIEIVNMQLRTAIVRGPLEPSDYELFANIESLHIEPASRDFVFRSPLLIPNLHTLYVRECDQPILQMVAPESLQNLRTFISADAAPAMNGISALGELPRLKSLHVHRQELSQEVLGWVARQSALISLYLATTNASDSAIANLACHESLRLLDIWRTNVSLRSSDAFAGPFPALRSLDVSETQVAGSSIETMEYLFPAIERFVGRDALLETADVKRIASWSRMRVLDTNTPGVDFDLHQDQFWDT